MRPSVTSPWLTRLTLAGAGFAFTTGLAFAQPGPTPCPPLPIQPSPAQIEEGTKAARDRGFLWRATKDGHTSYLYGTVHVGKLDWMFPGAAVLEALHSAGVVALELDVLDPNQARLIQEGIAARPDQKLPDALMQRLRAQLRAACLPEVLLNTTSPEMIATTLTVLSARTDGIDPAYAIDTMYATRARSLHKPVASLETPELQLKLLMGRTVREAEESVRTALDDLESGKASPLLVRIADVWANGRLEELESYDKWCACMKTDSDRAMMRRMLDDRNPGLAQGIDAIHASGASVFAAVGSLHMIGKRGVPALLVERGYQVERVQFGSLR
jgi:uncharacterized protein YbaP (TraB family)